LLSCHCEELDATKQSSQPAKEIAARLQVARNDEVMDIFKNTQFLKLWGNQVLLQVAFNMSNFTALLLVNHLTNSRFSVALLYAALTLPAFAVGIFAGAVVDLSDRKKLMLITDVCLAILFALYALASHHLVAILAIAFTSASIAQFFTPAEAATLPLVVSNHQWEKANSLFLFTALGSVMLGYALAGPIIELFGGIGGDGAQFTFLVAGAVTAVGFLLRLSLRTIDTLKPEHLSEKFLISTIKLTAEVVKLAREKEKIYLSLLLLVLVEFNIGLLSILFIDFVRSYLKLATTATSYFLVIPLVGGLVLGVSVLGKVQQKVARGKAIFVSMLVFSLVILVLGVCTLLATTSLLRILTVAGAFLIGCTIVFVAVNPRTILQENSSPEMLGRIFSLVTISSAAVAPIPVMLIALITEKVPTPTVFIIYGIAFLGLSSFLRERLVKHLN